MPYITKEVEIDMGDFDDEELIDELNVRGYQVVDSVILKELESLYSNYLTSSPETFDKELKKFFRDTLGKIIY